MSMIGLNADSIYGVARDLRLQSDELWSISQAVNSLLSSAASNWSGSDLEQFDQLWSNNYQKVCLQLRDDLNDLADVAESNARDQEEISSTLEGDSGSLSASGSSVFSLNPQANYSSDVLTFLESIIGIAEVESIIEAIQKAPAGTPLSEIMTANPLLSALGYLPKAYDAFSSAAMGELDSISALSFTGDTLDLGSTFLEFFGSSPFGEVSGKVLGGAAGAFKAASDLGKVQESLKNGNPLTAGYHMVHGAAAGVGAVVKPVGLCVTAWDAGTALGTAIASSPPANSFYDAIVDYGKRQGGEIGSRYEGLGFVNMIGDAGGVIAENSVSGVKNLVDNLPKIEIPFFK